MIDLLLQRNSGDVSADTSIFGVPYGEHIGIIVCNNYFQRPLSPGIHKKIVDIAARQFCARYEVCSVSYFDGYWRGKLEHNALVWVHLPKLARHDRFWLYALALEFKRGQGQECVGILVNGRLYLI